VYLHPIKTSFVVFTCSYSQEVKVSDGGAKKAAPSQEAPAAAAADAAAAGSSGGAGSSKRSSGAGGGNRLVVRDDAVTLKEVGVTAFRVSFGGLGFGGGDQGFGRT
jgi:hypothetical protein